MTDEKQGLKPETVKTLTYFLLTWGQWHRDSDRETVSRDPLLSRRLLALTTYGFKSGVAQYIYTPPSSSLYPLAGDTTANGNSFGDRAVCLGRRVCTRLAAPTHVHTCTHAPSHARTQTRTYTYTRCLRIILLLIICCSNMSNISCTSAHLWEWHIL